MPKPDKQAKGHLPILNFTDLPLRQHDEWATRTRVEEPSISSDYPQMLADLLKALVLGIVEGVTEFLPVSSTGHLLLVERFMDLDRDNFWKTFAVMIQLGAILAILVIYFGRLWRVALGMFSDPAARRFVIGVLLAFFPAVVLGLIFGSFIKSVLFNPWVVCFTLIAGGAVLLWVDQQDFKPRYHDAMVFSLPMYLGIGVAQCAAMIPGVSRSGASLVAKSDRSHVVL